MTLAAVKPRPVTHPDAEQVTAKSKSNFALSFLFLPKEQRRAITRFYAFSRLVDDAVDDYPPDEAKERIAFWKEEVRLCFEGTPSHPVTLGLQDSINRFQIPRKYLDLLVEGCEWDLTKNRYQNFEELYQYCYRVAGCIGLVCMKIFGLSGPEAESSAEDLGLALQLTNILRDISEDAERDRLYLPLEDLNRYRLTEAEVMSGKQSPRLFTLLKLMSERAEVNYHRAFTKMRRLPRKPLVAAWIMGRVYFKILEKIRARSYDVYAEKVELSSWTKGRIALGEFSRALFSRSSSPSQN